jgi:hypothetical protein
MHTLKVIAAIALIAILSSACSSLGSRAGNVHTARGLSEDQRHRLYAAALAASDSPLDSQEFKSVCRAIGIFDVNDRPNEQYSDFVGEHVRWTMDANGKQFRLEIDTKDKARNYLSRYFKQ